MKRSQVVWLAVTLGTTALLGARPATAQFREMAGRVPREANALVLLNLEKIYQSPKAVQEGWKEKVDNAFQAGLVYIPPKAVRYVLASQIDFEYMKPAWEASVIDLEEPPSLEKIAERYRGTADEIGGAAAVMLPQDAFVVQLGPKTVGAMSPAYRQQVLRWVRQSGNKNSPPLSPYLEKGAGYSDKAGTEIIIVLDLEGVFPPERIQAYLKKKKSLDAFHVDRALLAKLLAGIQGLRIGVRIGDKPFGKLTIDFQQDSAAMAECAKPLLLEAVADAGMWLDDLDQWKSEVQGNTVSMEGYLSSAGLRKLMSVVESAAPEEEDAKEPPAAASPGDVAANQGKTTLKYFQSIDKFFTDLKNDMRNMKTWGQSAVWFDKYARKIERLPMLGVDPEMLDYGKFAASALRNGSLETRNLNIQSGVAQIQVQGSSPVATNPYVYGGYGNDRGGYGPGWYGSVTPAYAYEQALRQEGQQRRIVRKETHGNIASGIQSIKDEVAKATTDIRRKMSDRYQLEF